jgi:hypothetical protein
VNIEWLNLLNVTVATIAVAVAVVGLMAGANRLLFAGGDDARPTLAQRVLAYAMIGVMALIVLSGIYLLVHAHVERLLGIG